MWRYTYNLRGLYETPALTENSELDDASRQQVEQIIQTARKHGRLLLTEARIEAIVVALWHSDCGDAGCCERR